MSPFLLPPFCFSPFLLPVDFSDVLIKPRLVVEFEMFPFLLPPAIWSEGDLNYDNAVTISDFIDLSTHFGASLPAAAQRALSLSLSTQKW
jgi:hypothetical protein